MLQSSISLHFERWRCFLLLIFISYLKCFHAKTLQLQQNRSVCYTLTFKKIQMPKDRIFISTVLPCFAPMVPPLSRCTGPSSTLAIAWANKRNTKASSEYNSTATALTPAQKWFLLAGKKELSQCHEALFPKGEGKVNKPHLCSTACLPRVEMRYNRVRLRVSLLPIAWVGRGTAELSVLISMSGLSHTLQLSWFTLLAHQQRSQLCPAHNWCWYKHNSTQQNKQEHLLLQMESPVKSSSQKPAITRY